MCRRAARDSRRLASDQAERAFAAWHRCYSNPRQGRASNGGQCTGALYTVRKPGLGVAFG
jgi:hypothetical protein